MNGSGSNRYELLYVDDDASDPLDNLVHKKAKQQKQKTTDSKSIISSKAQHGQQHHSVGGASLKNHQQNHNTTTTINSGTNKKLQSQIHHNNGESGKQDKSDAIKRNIDNEMSGCVGGGQKPKNSALSNNTRGGNDLRCEGKIEVNVDFKQYSEVRERNNSNRNELDDRPIQNDLLPSSGDFSYKDQHQRTPRNSNRRGYQRSRIFYGKGKREFDRQSGSNKTNVKAVDKRDGAGAYNWGSLKQNIGDLNKSNYESNTIKDESIEQKTEQMTQAEEKTKKELTLDEWKAQRAVQTKPQYNIRKAGEGEDMSQCKKMVALNKKKDEKSEEELEYDSSMYPQRVRRLQRVLDIDFHFIDGRRKGSTGRGRGPRGAGGRHEQRNTDQSKSDGHNLHQNVPKVDDEDDFPSLG